MAFASLEDIKARAGRPLSEADEAAAQFLLLGAQVIVEAAIEKTEEQLGDAPSPVLRFIAVEVVCRAMANPHGLSSETEAIGAYSHSERFRSGENSDILLTKAEELLARRAVHGTLSGSAEPASLADDAYALYRMAPSLVNGQWIWNFEGLGS